MASDHEQAEHGSKDVETLVAAARAAQVRSATARALAAKATPGPLDVIPWPGERGPDGGWGVCDVETLIVRTHAPVRSSKEDDAAFFADARTSVPDLCDVTDVLAAGVLGLAADNAALVAGVGRLEARMRRRSTLTFGVFEATEGGGVEVPYRGAPEVIEFVFGTFAGLLEGKGGGTRANNYIEMRGHHPAIGGITVTIQRVGMVTPHGARTAAEEALARAVALLAEHGIPWEGATTFPPDAPEPLPPRAPSATPWVRLDVDHRPNQMVCHNCGVMQALPEEHTVAIFTAMHEAFTAAHANCEDRCDEDEPR